MKLLDNFIAIFSPMMRSALELGRLNEIWGEFNDKNINQDEVLTLLLSNKWKYHIDKAKLLLDFTTLIPPYAKNLHRNRSRNRTRNREVHNDKIS